MSSGDDHEVGLPPAMSAVLRQPVDGYIGLTVTEARSLAEEQGRHLQVRFSGRKSLKFRRVQVELDEGGRVSAVRAG